ncbi:ankyrin repeat domain-containing protein [Kordiimonas lacus]|uniref:Ankyrin repeat n=1 Tax=Kordiimonas lacus TaxID=637679 RepID=A0A1G6ULE7_9PROT|nr:ankyrin repeat domain-containing protein [Kordiimonas lacus]SDD41546.1 Ankyrin repeat [Kordiimonas lacus]
MKRLGLSFLLLAFFTTAASADAATDKALMDAIMASDSEAALASLEAGADPAATDDKGASTLFRAVQKKLQPVTEALLEKGADPNVQWGDYMGATPLMLAVQVQDMDLAGTLLEYGADVNVADNNGDPAINWAAYYGYEDFVELFLMHDADTSLTGHGNALEIAMRRGHQGLVKMLNTSHDMPSPDAAFMVEAIEAGDDAGVAEALMLGVPADTLDFTDRPVLALAARLGHGVIVERLLAAGAPVDQPDAIGFTPLMEAVRDGQLETATLLLEAGADANHRSEATALHLTPMHMAGLSGKPEMVRLLAEAGADVDPLGRENATPLAWALSEGKIETSLALLDLGADPMIKSSYGYTPADMAKGMGNKALLEKMGLSENQE